MNGANRHADEESSTSEAADSSKLCAVDARRPRVLPYSVIDIGVNLTHRCFRNHWEDVVKRAADAGVESMVLTGTTVRSSRESLRLARAWSEKYEIRSDMLRCTVGVHPHDAKTFRRDGRTVTEMRDLLDDPFAVAVGECGLDYNRNFSPREDQLYAFREQVSLACELRMPLFVHEREAHADLLRVLDEFECLPPLVVHCFTGNLPEAKAYLDRGFYIGFTGTICKKERGAHLRELIPEIPIDRIMIETDAPFMSFVKGRRTSEPAHVVGVAEQLSETLGLSLEDVCAATTENAKRFFGLS